MKLNPDGKTVAAMDCLVPGIGEIIGGSQSEDDYDKLLGPNEGAGAESKRIMSSIWICASTALPAIPVSALVLRRCVMYLTGMGNIRDVIPFPRTVKNCDL